MSNNITKIPARAVIGLIHIYQATLSHWIGRQCRFIPTCSNYCIEAIQEYGVIKGVFLGCWRILRCNPLFKGGYDPVKK